MAAERVAVVLGATGLVGGHLLDLLLADPGWRVVSLGRRHSGRVHPRLAEHVVELDQLASRGDLFTGAVAAFCCLGTTLQKAGGREAFARVDRDGPVAAAQAALSAEVPHFLLVTAAGADEGALFFYNRIKGQTERAIGRGGIESVSILRPSLILGERDHRRPLESAAQRVGGVLGPLMIGPLARLRAVPAERVARAMLRLAAGPRPGVRIVENEEIFSLGAGDG